MSGTRDGLIGWVVETLVLIVAFVFAIALGVLMPGLAAMKLLYVGGWIGHGPDAPGVFWGAVRYAVLAAAGLVLGGRILGLGRHGLFVGSYIAMLFAYSLVMPLLFASLIMMPVHAIVSPLFGIDAWREWRPLLHAALAVGGAVMSLKMHLDERHTFDIPAPASGYTLPRFARGAATGMMNFGTMLGEISRPSSESAGGSWSDDSGGGDSD